MAKKETEGEALNPQQEKLKALQAAMSKIEKDFGKGSIMRMGDEQIEQVDVIPTGSIGLNAALGVGGYPKGRIIEIYGPESSGKTTLADLICRFYDAGEGEIRVFGRAIDSYGLKELPRVCGIVPQHNVLFAGTVRDNMRTVDPEADDSRIWQALGTAQASDFIGELPEGLDAQVETGGRNFSGGQRQRLAIARAITAHPPVLVLDDCSSALDYATDAALRAALKKDLAQTTVFIISQRAATVRDADRILVLDDGRVENIGAHEDLLEKSPVYREICSSQGLIPKEEGVGA